MKRMVFRSVAKLTEDPVEIFWLAGFALNERNEWKIRVVYRNKRTSKLISVYEPIGMLPILSLGMCFDHGLLKTDELPGQMLEIVVPDVGNPDVITSADVPGTLYPLPEGKTGRQRLFRYQTAQGAVLIPAVELIRALFIHNRSLALALMRPAGLEQLYAPMAPGWRDSVLLRFTQELAKNTLSRELAMEFAWIVLDSSARRSWDSVRCMSAGQDFILFKPPTIKNSTWSFRGVSLGDQYFVLELLYVGGRSLPTGRLKYTHPGLKRVVNISKPGTRSGNSLGEGSTVEQKNEDIDVDDGEEGSTSYRNPYAMDSIRRSSLFENKVNVFKIEKVERKEVEPAPGKPKRPKSPRSIQVTTGERAGTASLRPMEFKLLANVALARMGDLEALDETVRHMRDKLPDVAFVMGLVQLKQGKTAASVGSTPRAAMVVRISPAGRPPIVMIDIERTGILALSLMVLHFGEGATEVQIEDAIKEMLGGWADAGGHWSASIEACLQPICHCDRIPKAMIPRAKFEKMAEVWAHRLIDRFAL